MTDPHPQHHPDEQYIITEHELFLFAANGFFDREERLEMYHAIQQRPYNAIPTPAPAAPEPHCYDNCEQIQNAVKMSICQARKDEREKVIEILSDLNKYSCEEYEEASLSDNGREMRIHLEYGNRTWGIIRSLRGGAL